MRTNRPLPLTGAHNKRLNSSIPDLDKFMRGEKSKVVKLREDDWLTNLRIRVAEVDRPIQEFFKVYPMKSDRTKEFIQLMMQGYDDYQIAELLDLKKSYVQTRISKYMMKYKLNRFLLMTKIYQIARDMDGLEKSESETAYQYLLRPDSVD